MFRFFWLLFRPVVLLTRILKRIDRALFGQFAWTPPPWHQSLTRRVHFFRRAHPRILAAGIILALLLAGGSIGTWRWYQRQPKPHTVSASVSSISVTPLEKELKFPPLTVTFSEPAARLEDLRKPKLDRVRLEPSQPGDWKWIDDRKLVFEPSEDWPADRKFQIVFAKELFAPQVRMERLQYEVATPPFRVEIKSFTLSEDVKEPGVQRMLAEVALTHSVEPGELEKHATLAMLGESDVFPPNDPRPHFTINYGLHNRQAFLRSAPITLPKEEDWMRVVIEKGLSTTQGGATTSDPTEEKTKIPSGATAFQIGSVDGGIVRNKAGEPEQILNLETTGDIDTNAVAQSLHIFLLPKRPSEKTEETAAESPNEETTAEEESTEESSKSDEGADGDEEKETSSTGATWANAGEVTAEVLRSATPVQFTTIPSGRDQARDHHFKFKLEGDGQLYVRVDKGTRGVSGYELAEDYTSLLTAPELPQEVEIQGDGGLLALSGERNLSIKSRGVPLIKFEIDRVAASQINHLVSQTEGTFQTPEFLHGSFDEENISRIAHEDQPINVTNRWAANYSAFDFTSYLQKPADGGSERGLFFLHANGFDPATKKNIKGAAASRFVLVSNLGLLVKKNADHTSDVFVASIKTGTPVFGATVELLGKNGIAIATGLTNPDGRATLPAVEKNAPEKKPVAYVVRLGDDLSFIPYERDDRLLNFSRFDIDGVTHFSPENLEAFVFTERGVYRPGDEIHIGVVVKQKNWQGKLTGLPVETEVVDARDLKVQTKKLALPASGFAELSYQTAYESPSGEYRINVYLVKNAKRSTLLGSVSVNVKEFLPDRMKIEAQLSKSSAHGWVDPKEMRASIALANLYGTPATARRVKSHLKLSPAEFSFAEFPDYTFYDSLLDAKKNRQEETVDLGEQKTDDAGHAEMDLQLERFADATYAMQFFAEAFEADGGRSVTGQASTLVSALPSVVGYKADGALNYINADTPRAVDLLAIDPQLQRIPLADVTLKVIVQEYVSAVTKKENGSYAYQSVLKERVAKTEAIAITPDGLHYQLPTAEPGDYVIELRGEGDRLLSKIRFSVVGRGPGKGALDKNSELQVKLDRAQYNTGDEVAISITAPYAGSGVITIERDKVYAQRWFKADAASSVQKIRVPEGFEGSGYINVALIRPLDSKEIFTSPLSYGVVPFTANKEKRRLKIDLQTVAIAKPGEPLHIGYQADRACKIVVFAVDQGILQVSDYKLPDPLGFFFRKSALGVETSQIVDLIMPEFSVLRSLSAFGGDGEANKELNPFKRVTEKPVVFWSGIVDAGVDRREVVYDVPDYFSGTLTVMAVAVSDDATGAAQRDALVRGPFVITPSVPVLAAPGDQFEVGVTIANNVEGSGPNAAVQLRADPSEHLQIVQTPTQPMAIAEGREETVVFTVRANDQLGSGSLTFIAGAGGKETKLRSTISIRPPAPFMTQVRSGQLSKSNADVAVTRQLYAEHRQLSASLSALPLGLARGLEVYLKEFPHGCSEQIASAAFCRLALADEVDFGLNRAEVSAQLEKAFSILRRRQNDKGDFGYWTVETEERIHFMPAYAMHFLIEAKAAGFAPPAEMFASGLRYLQTMVAQDPTDLDEARTVAYAIYLLTREGVLTTNYIINLRDYLEKNFAKEWPADTTGVYLAGALQILHKDDEAGKLIAKYRIGEHDAVRRNDFYQPLGADAQYLSVLAREFPARLKKISPTEFEHIVKPIGDGDFNTLSAAYAVLALKAYSHALAAQPPELSIAEIDQQKREKRLTSGKQLLQHADFSETAAALRFHNGGPIGPLGAFYQVIEAGYDRQLPSKAVADGLEIYRELLDADGKPVTRTQLGEPINVRLRVRSLRPSAITNVAVVDLLPGGFEVVGGSLRSGASSINGVDFVEVREDRAVFYLTALPEALEIKYQIKSTNRGEFTVAPAFAESMYDRAVRAQGVSGKITVTEGGK
ncbi:MAG: alpha-2-macroglobulin [Chthoniobacterales bacterium]